MRSWHRTWAQWYDWFTFSSWTQHDSRQCTWHLSGNISIKTKSSLNIFWWAPNGLPDSSHLRLSIIQTSVTNWPILLHFTPRRHACNIPVNELQWHKVSEWGYKIRLHSWVSVVILNNQNKLRNPTKETRTTSDSNKNNNNSCHEPVRRFLRDSESEPDFEKTPSWPTTGASFCWAS